MGKRRRKKSKTRIRPEEGREPSTKTQRRVIIRFLVVFFACWAALLVVGIRFGDRLLFLNTINAKMLFHLMSFFGFNTYISGSVVSFNQASMEIITECTGLQLFQIMLALVIAFPATIKQKLIGFGIGVPYVIVINTIRLIVISLVLWKWPSYFEIVHQYVWQIVLIALVLAYGIWWMRKVSEHAWRTRSGTA